MKGYYYPDRGGPAMATELGRMSKVKYGEVPYYNEAGQLRYQRGETGIPMSGRARHNFSRTRPQSYGAPKKEF